MCKHQNLTLKTKIDVFSPLLRSIVAAGVTIDATVVYEWSISRRARNAEAHRVTGNVRRSKIPECVKNSEIVIALGLRCALAVTGTSAIPSGESKPRSELCHCSTDQNS